MNEISFRVIKILIFIAVWMCLVSLHAQSNDAFSNSIRFFSKYNYYTTESEVTIVCILPDSAIWHGLGLSVLDRGLRVLQTNEFAGPVLHSKIPIQKFSFGKNQLILRLSNHQKLVKESMIEVNRLKPAANEVKIDLETGGLVVNDLPFFPVGFYCGPVGSIPEQEVVHGFNLIGPYQHNLPEGLPERKAYMDRCAEIGMKVQYGVNSLIGSGHNGAKGLDKTEEEKMEILRSEILAFKDHPALLSWYINDEPDGQGRSPQLLEKAYQLIHQLDSYHPVSIVFMMPQKFHEFKNTMDIAMTDPYPIPNSVDIRGYVRQLYNDFAYQKSIWLVPQAFGGQEMWPREPTPKEIRVMTYLGLMEGVKGIQYFIRTPSDINPQAVAAWSECSNMAVEINQMTPFLLSDEKQEVLMTDHPDVLAKCFSYKGEKLVMVVNTSNKPLHFESDLKLSNDLTSADLWFENRTVNIHNAKLDDFVDALGTRIYRFKKNDKLISTDLISQHNLIYNPGFEVVTSPGLATGHHVSYGFPNKADHGATVFSDSRQQIEGLFSLRLITPRDSGGVKVQMIPIALQGGNSYAVSVWAKAAKQDKMPRFKLSMEGIDDKKEFELSDHWGKYTFLMKVATSTANAIVNLELLDKGTAWFDLLQVSPEPLLDYKILDDHSALVSMATTMDSGTLKYSFASPEPSNEQVYFHPFIIKQAASLQARVVGKKGTLVEGSIFVPVNKALGKPIHFSTPYQPQYAAAGDSSLTDGVMGTTSFRDKKWLGFNDSEVSFTIDMKESTIIDAVTLNTLCDPNSGIFLPKSISVFTSPDETNYQLAGHVDNKEISKRGEPYLVSFEVKCKKGKAKYIRVIVKTFGEIPEGYLFKGSTSWFFADEILVR